MDHRIVCAGFERVKFRWSDTLLL